MILGHTKLNGYSLGLPLWWPDDQTNISTGWLQGIHLVVTGVPQGVYLSRYQRDNRKLDLVFSLEDEILCSLSARVGSKPETFKLTAMSNKFVEGYVTFYGPDTVEEVDLTGAQVCPKYITFVDHTTAISGTFTLAQTTPDNKLTFSSVPLNTLTVVSSSTVIATESADVVLTIESLDVPILFEDSNLYTINGDLPDSNGNINITLPKDWAVSQVSNSQVKIGIIGQGTSCPDASYIDQRLNPGNFTQDCPLSIAFSGSNGTFDLEKIVCHRFNTMYEHDGAGLAWNEFSALHDDLTFLTTQEGT